MRKVSHLRTRVFVRRKLLAINGMRFVPHPESSNNRAGIEDANYETVAGLREARGQAIDEQDGGKQRV
jgi:hypothetical protein